MGIDNKTDIEGNFNIVIQGCSDLNDTNIQVNSFDKEGFISELNEILNRLSLDYSPLNILVITTTVKNLKKLNNTSFQSIKDKYSNDLVDWHPFHDDNTILELLKEYQIISGFTINPYFIDNEVSENDDEYLVDLIDEIKLRREKTVLILDIIALSYEGNSNAKIATIFDDHSIGGCLIPICQDFNETTKNELFQTKRKVLNQISRYTEDYPKYMSKFDNHGFVQIALNISNKSELFRKLTNIAVLHLKIRKQVTDKSDPVLKEFSKVQSLKI